MHYIIPYISMEKLQISTIRGYYTPERFYRLQLM